MEIGKRLRELRKERGLSQHGIEKRTGVLCCHVSKIEKGRLVPSLGTLEKLAQALDLEFYQLFYEGEGKPEAPRAAPTTPKPPLGSEEAALLRVFGKMSKPKRMLLLAMARKMAATGRPASVTRAKE